MNKLNRKIWRCKRCGNVVQTDHPYDEDRCYDPKAPGGYWYCDYEELVPKKVKK